LHQAHDGPPPETVALQRINWRGVRLHRERVAFAFGFVVPAGAAAVVSCPWVFAD